MSLTDKVIVFPNSAENTGRVRVQGRVIRRRRKMHMRCSTRMRIAANFLLSVNHGDTVTDKNSLTIKGYQKDHQKLSMVESDRTNGIAGPM